MLKLKIGLSESVKIFLLSVHWPKNNLLKQFRWSGWGGAWHMCMLTQAAISRCHQIRSTIQAKCIDIAETLEVTKEVEVILL